MKRAGEVGVVVSQRSESGLSCTTLFFLFLFCVVSVNVGQCQYQEPEYGDLISALTPLGLYAGQNRPGHSVKETLVYLRSTYPTFQTPQNSGQQEATRRLSGTEELLVHGRNSPESAPNLLLPSLLCFQKPVTPTESFPAALKILTIPQTVWQARAGGCVQERSRTYCSGCPRRDQGGLCRYPPCWEPPPSSGSRARRILCTQSDNPTAEGGHAAQV